MIKSFQFMSLTLLTQLVLLLNQLVLLPLQVRSWGNGVTASWYAVLAVCALTTAADLGLRTAGHAELVRGAQAPFDKESRLRFSEIWGWIRLAMIVATVLLLAADALYQIGWARVAWPLWHGVLVLAIALETLVIVRVMYLDSLGLYRESEGSYLLLAASRFGFASLALVFLHASVATLAWIWLLTSLLGLAIQMPVCRRAGVLSLLEPLPAKLDLRSLVLARYTLAEPCSNWVRLNLPVIVLSIIAPPTVIVTYVALRALFGATRQMVQQLSRYASVEYLGLWREGRAQVAKAHLTFFVLFAALAGASGAGFIVVDNFRLTSLWLLKTDRLIFQTIALPFAAAATFYSYQIVAGLMLRRGEIAAIGRRQYAYILYSGLFALIALLTHSLAIFLLSLFLAEAMIASSFLFVLEDREDGFAASRGLLAAAWSAGLVLVLWLIVNFGGFIWLVEMTPHGVAASTGLLLGWLAVLLAGYAGLSRGVLVQMKTWFRFSTGSIERVSPSKP